MTSTNIPVGNSDVYYKFVALIVLVQFGLNAEGVG